MPGSSSASRGSFLLSSAAPLTDIPLGDAYQDQVLNVLAPGIQHWSLEFS